MPKVTRTLNLFTMLKEIIFNLQLFLNRIKVNKKPTRHKSNKPKRKKNDHQDWRRNGSREIFHWKTKTIIKNK